MVLEKELLQNDRAPYGGVLVPWPQYYYYNDAVEKIFEAEAHPVECDTCSGPVLKSALISFGVGVMAGLYLESKR